MSRPATAAAGIEWRILEAGSGGLVLAADRSGYLPVLFSQSFGDAAGIPRGVDLLSTPAGRETALRARETGRPSASLLDLPMASPPGDNVLSVFVPVHAKPLTAAEGDRLRTQWNGAVVGTVDLGRLLAQAVVTTGLPRPLVHVQMLAGSSSSREDRRAITFGEDPMSAIFQRIPALPEPSPGTAFRLTRSFAALDHDWILTLDYSATVAPAPPWRQAVIWPAFALILTALASYAVMLETRRTRQAVDVADRRAEEIAAILDAIPALVWISTDPEGRRVIGNRVANALLNVPRDTNVSYDAGGIRQRQAIRMLREDGGEFAPDELPLRRAVALGRPVHDVAIDFRFGDGRRVEVIGNATPLFDSRGNVRGAIAAFVDVTERKKAEEQLRVSLERIETLSEKMMRIQDAERRLLAQELHDEIGQAMTAVKLRLQSIERLAELADSPALTENVSEALLAATQALAQVRGMALDLRPLQLDHHGLAETLRSLVDRQAAVGGWTVHFDENLGRVRLAPALEIACFRIAQEAMTNILRHADARQVWVSLRRDADWLCLTVRDDGRGFDTAATDLHAGRSLGLPGMAERARGVGGSMSIVSTPGDGTQLTARLPFAPGGTDDPPRKVSHA